MLEKTRMLMFSIPVVLSPPLLFLLLSVPYTHDHQSANLGLASYLILSVVSVSLFQFGVVVSNERLSPWDGYLRTLPLSPWVRMAARILSALVFALSSACCVVILAAIFTPISFSWSTIPLLFLAVLIGAITFSLFGLAIGYWVKPQAASALANLLYILLAFVGGIFIAPSGLPDLVNAFAPYLPIRQYCELAWNTVSGKPWPLGDILGLLGYALLFGLCAIWSYWRDEGQHFR
jgi:ABC-2 type transport system permease protein